MLNGFGEHCSMEVRLRCAQKCYMLRCTRLPLFGPDLRVWPGEVCGADATRGAEPRLNTLSGSCQVSQQGTLALLLLA